MVTASNEPSSKGSSSAEPCTNSMSGWRRRPSSSMPGLMSSAVTSAPAFAIGAAEAPVPAATSRMRSPGLGLTARCMWMRHSLSLPPESSELSRSYRLAVASNMPATSSGSFCMSARFTCSILGEPS